MEIGYKCLITVFKVEDILLSTKPDTTSKLAGLIIFLMENMKLAGSVGVLISKIP